MVSSYGKLTQSWYNNNIISVAIDASSFLVFTVKWRLLITRIVACIYTLVPINNLHINYVKQVAKKLTTLQECTQEFFEGISTTQMLAKFLY